MPIMHLMLNPVVPTGDVLRGRLCIRGDNGAKALSVNAVGHVMQAEQSGD